MRRTVGLVLAVGLLGGCNAVGGIVGGLSGAGTGVATGNPAVGYAVGVSVKAATDSVVQYVMRSLARGEQTAIATAAGGLAVGQTADWIIEHGLPFGYENAKGTVQVTRVMNTPLAACREVVIDVVDDADHQYLIATTCQQEAGQWRWASAEPAVERWGALQ